MERRREFKLVRRTLPSAVAQTVDKVGFGRVGGSASGTAEALRLFRAVSGGRRTERASSPASVEPAAGIDANVRLHAEVVSRPLELPLQPLAEPYVTLPRHTAPVIQPVARPPANDGTAVGWPPASCPAIRHWAECAHEEP